MLNRRSVPTHRVLSGLQFASTKASRQHRIRRHEHKNKVHRASLRNGNFKTAIRGGEIGKLQEFWLINDCYGSPPVGLFQMLTIANLALSPAPAKSNIRSMCFSNDVSV